MDILKKIENLSVFKGLNKDELRNIIKYIKPIREYKESTIIFNTGDKIKYFGILLEGQIELAIEDLFGNKTILSKFSAPALFAESVLIRNIEEIPLSVISKTDTKVCFFDYHKYKLEDTKSIKKVQHNLIYILAGKNVFMRDKLNLLSLSNTRAKIMYYLTNESRKHNSKYFDIDYNITELAQYLNLNRSSLSRELSKLKKEGLIDYQNKTFKIL